MHLMGGTITVTPKMKSFFWAMYYQSAGSVKKTSTGKVSRSKSNIQATGDAAFWQAMALKKQAQRSISQA